MLYLAKIKYYIITYEYEEVWEEHNEIRLVDAENEYNAERKVEDHYNLKSSKDNVYRVSDICITSTIT